MATFFLTLNYARSVYQKISVRGKGDSVRRPIRPSVDCSEKEVSLYDFLVLFLVYFKISEFNIVSYFCLTLMLSLF